MTASPSKLSAASLRAGAATAGVTPRLAAALLGLQILAIALEAIGLGLVAPIVEYIQAGGDAETLSQSGGAWRLVERLFAGLGLEADLGPVLAAAFLAILLRQVVMYAANTYRIRTRERLIHRLRSRLFDGFMRAPQAARADFRTGETVNEIVIEAGRAVRAAVQLVRLAGSLLLMGAYIIGLLLLSPVMTLGALAALALLSVALGPLLRRSWRRSDGIVSANRRLAGFVTEWFRQAKLIHLCGRFDVAAASMQARSREQAEHAAELQVLAERATLFIIPSAVGAALLVLYLGVSVAGTPIEILAVFVIAIMRLLPVLKEVLSDAQAFLANFGSMHQLTERLGALDRASAEEPSARPQVGALRITQAVRFETVSYRYPAGERPALDRVSFEIPAGRITALVGPSGSGKSTLVELATGLRRPQEGRVLFDREDLANRPSAEVHRAVAYVPQEAGVLDLSVAEFLALGRPTASRAEIELAAARAGADAFIQALPGGYDAPLGENGDRLSGGQRQRLDLARALVQSADLLILDEPSSQLDPVAARQLAASLRRLCEEVGCTVVLVSHGADLAGEADHVVVLEEGRIADVGAPADLADGSGWYADAFAAHGAVARRRAGTR